MSKEYSYVYDPPSDPFGNGKRCLICDEYLIYDNWTKTWYCGNDHSPEENDVEKENNDECEDE